MADRPNLHDGIFSPNQLPQLAAFVSVVAAGSFTAAAKRTGIDKALLSRRVQALEAALQTRLLNRTTRRLHVTEAGRSLYERASGPLAEIAESLALTASSEGVAGTVRVATVPALGGELWGPVLRELSGRHPGLHVHVRATETLVSLVDEGFDLGVRAGRMPSSSLIARKLATWRFILVASPDWQRAHADIESPADLVDHWLLYDDVPNAHKWRFERGDEAMELRVRAHVAADNSEILLGATLAGVGVTAMAPFAAAAYLQRGELVRLFPSWRIVHRHGIYAVTPHREYAPRRVEIVRDAVARRLLELQGRWLGLSE